LRDDFRTLDQVRNHDGFSLDWVDSVCAVFPGLATRAKDRATKALAVPVRVAPATASAIDEIHTGHIDLLLPRLLA